MPELSTVLDGIGTLLNVGGTLNSGAKSRSALDQSAKAARQAGDNAFNVSRANSAAYRAAGDNARTVAEYNAKQFELRAQQLKRQGEEIARKGVTEEGDLRSAVAQLIGSQRASYAAGNVIVNRGTPAAMQISTARAGEVDALRIRDNYISLLDDNKFEQQQAIGQAGITRAEGDFAKQAAYNQADVIDLEGGYAKDAAYNQAGAYEAEGENIEEGSWIDAAGTLLSSPVAQKWLLDTFGKGGGSGGGVPGAGGILNKPLPGGGVGAINTVWDGLASAGAGVVGGYTGQKVGEEITGRQANNNWGAGILGTAGAVIGGPMGAAIGGAIGGLLDAAFGGRSYSHNSGFFLKDLPGVQNDGDREKFQVEPFASGLQPVGFTRRTTRQEAINVMKPFRAMDQVIVDAAKEFGKTITADYVTGLDETGTQEGGVFLGAAGEDGKPGKAIAQQVEDYATGLLKSLQGQVSDQGYAEIMGAGNAGQKIIKMREVLARETTNA